ncbi:HAD family hydrolase [Maledivibacter halophilus]|nr:HAD family hydrolase [Maledivibacter halophilus]
MKKIKVICIDMFQTLVNVYTRKEFIWKRILGKGYTKELEEKYANLVDKKIIEKFHEDVSSRNNFINFKMIFLEKFTEVFQELKLNLSPMEATKIFIEEHGFAELYEDSNEFIEIVGKDYPICLVSDADIEMVRPLLEKFNFDMVFISEQIKSYKKDKEGTIFKKVLEHYKVEPEEVIHIGDTSSDILGANRVGITTCWINRNNYMWKYEVNPMHEIRTLLEVLPLLDIGYEKLINGEEKDFA